MRATRPDGSNASVILSQKRWSADASPSRTIHYHFYSHACHSRPAIPKSRGIVLHSLESQPEQACAPTPPSERKVALWKVRLGRGAGGIGDTAPQPQGCRCSIFAVVLALAHVFNMSAGLSRIRFCVFRAKRLPCGVAAGIPVDEEDRRLAPRGFLV